ncbi:PAS domain S-box protein [Aporhodopirellula aestuarii]|uniref:histidine kinase n=1 Tax=Aporhodopirellula aestuarii TaxID=2950107 RepID=A0ABT0TX07_9BACT|nr:PAS domain S-box protein [Aporhodopirellula aestuarii]MCM2369139.1 PAS domain S-box protein [Aporhodopirellula aestuarii]
MSDPITFDQRELLERDLRGQTRVLKRLAQGASLDEVLDTLVEVAEESRPEMIASILLLDEKTGCLHNGASRRLPDFYCAAVEGVKPGPNVGSCGTAAFTGQRVVVEDISTDPLWEAIRHVAAEASLRACWSEPIIGSSGEVLGTFAMYYQTPRAPTENELEFVSSSANLAALAIQRVRYQNSVERERAMLKTILNSVPDALISGHLDRKITHFNRSAGRIFGYDPEEVIGKQTAFLYANPDDYDRLLKMRFNAEQGETLAATEIQWRRKSGETFPGEIVGTTIRDEDGEPLGYMGLIRDITDRKIAEAKLAESQSKLVQAERLAAMGQMVSAIAHESRNALQRIQVSVDVLQYEIEAGSEAREDLERISRARADLERLHDELRSFAGPIQLNTSAGNMAETWRQAWTNLRVSRADRDAELVEMIPDVDLDCHFDAFRFEQVFRNLFENSLAACPDPVRITVRCQNMDIEGVPSLSISVHDNGPGLPEEIRSHVFEAFHTTKAKGTGLGMAIAKRLIEAHQGTIEIGNDGNDGAEFVIKMPRA